MSIRRPALIVCGACLVAAAAGAVGLGAQTPPSTRRLAPATPPSGLERAFADVDALVAGTLKPSHAGGLTVGVLSESTLVWSKGYGWADPDRKQAAGRDTIYRIGSITKQLTALALVQLQDRGRLRVSDPVSKYLPEVAQIQTAFPSAAPMTLLQLATMTSGLEREPDDVDTFLKGGPSTWERVLLAALPKTRIAFEPGTRYAYSNIGYALLGAALSRAAGEPFIPYLTREVITPLAMTATAFELEPTWRPRLAHGQAVRNGVIDLETPRREHAGRGYKIPNGGLYSTVPDIARWLAFELGNIPAGLVSRSAFEAWLGQVHSALPDLGGGYGIGFQVTRRPTLVAVGHSGSVAGYTSAAYVDRRSRTGVVILRSAGGDDVDVTELCLAALERVAAQAPRTH